MLTPLGAHRFSLVLAASALLGALAAPPAKAAQVQCRAWSTTQTQVFPVGSYFEDTSGTSSTDTWAVGINSNGNVIGRQDLDVGELERSKHQPLRRGSRFHY